MSYMKFKSDTNKTNKAKSLNTRKLVPARQYNWEIMREVGLAQRLEAKLVKTNDQGVKDDDLWRIITNDKPAYKELTVEFVASFSFTPGELDGDLNSRKTIHFRLLGKKYNMNLVEFAIHLGLQNKEDDLFFYENHLRLAQIEQATDFKVNTFWGDIAMVDYSPNNARETHLKSPYFRVLHRYLTWTLLYHQQDEKINEFQLKALHLILHNHQHWHIPYQMATMFVAIRSSTWHELPGGQFVTTIAENLGILSDTATRDFSIPLPVVIKERHTMVTSMILKKEGDGFRLYRDYEKKGAPGTMILGGGNTGASTSRGKRPRTFDEDEGGEQEISIKHVVNLLHLHGRYLDEVVQMLMRVDSRSQARYEIPFGTPLPDYYGDGWKMPIPWDAKTLNEAEEEANDAEEGANEEEDAAGDGGDEE